jgi:hypothetical protein
MSDVAEEMRRLLVLIQWTGWDLDTERIECAICRHEDPGHTEACALRQVLDATTQPGDCRVCFARAGSHASECTFGPNPREPR